MKQGVVKDKERLAKKLSNVEEYAQDRKARLDRVKSGKDED